MTRYGYVDWYSSEDESNNILTVMVEIHEKKTDTYLLTSYLCSPIGGFNSRWFSENQVRWIEPGEIK